MNLITPTTPVVIIGAGPVGLAAAARLTEYHIPFVVLEAGSQVGYSVLDWGHVQLFSPWRDCLDQTAVHLLESTDWQSPDPEAYPTGRDLVEYYLAPLAKHPEIAPYLRLNCRVTAISRAGIDKLSNAGRAQTPFVLQIVKGDGTEDLTYAGVVIDASGAYSTPNPLGANGLPAIGERAASAQIFYGIPDVLDTQRARYAGKRVLVAGSGHSAFNALLDLAVLAEAVPCTRITWVVRREAAEMAQAYGGGLNDVLPARGELGRRINTLVARGNLQLITSWYSDRVEQTAAGLVVHAGEQRLAPVDEIIVTTGLRPNLAMLSELRLDLDPSVEAPTALAPLIDPNLHSCGSVRPHGVDELSHSEPNFFIVGMKSYGRAPTFLLLTGYEQVRSVTAELAGDWKAARRVELELPETGVCSGPVVAGGGVATSCCGSEEHVVPVPRLFEVTPAVTLSSCCAPDVQSTCCAPEAKADCCGTTVVGATIAMMETGSRCGCQ